MIIEFKLMTWIGGLKEFDLQFELETRISTVFRTISIRRKIGIVRKRRRKEK